MTWYKIYNNYKSILIDEAKQISFDDKPSRRQDLNVLLDLLVSEISDNYLLSEKITNKAFNYVESLLSNLVCKLHIKNL